MRSHVQPLHGRSFALEDLALLPLQIRCSATVTHDPIVDCDGLVLPCCNDFGREQPIGNLAEESFAETMQKVARRHFGELMDRQVHDAVDPCRRFYGDVRTPDFPFDYPRRRNAAPAEPGMAG